MRIHSTPQSPLSALSHAKGSAPQTSFQNVLASKKNVLLDLKGDLKQVSADLKSGKISEEQASKQFVELVISKRNELNLSPKNLKQIQSAVVDLMSQDPTFVGRVQNELKRI